MEVTSPRLFPITHVASSLYNFLKMSTTCPENCRKKTPACHCFALRKRINSHSKLNEFPCRSLRRSRSWSSEVRSWCISTPRRSSSPGDGVRPSLVWLRPERAALPDASPLKRNKDRFFSPQNEHPGSHTHMKRERLHF